MTFKRGDSVGYLATQLARLLTQRLASRIAAFGLAPAPFVALLEIARDPGLTQRDLVKRLAIEQGTMTATLARMERDGLIERRSRANDRRAQSIYPTRKALAALRSATAVAEQINHEALSVLSPDDRGYFIGLLSRVIDGMQDSTPAIDNTKGAHSRRSSVQVPAARPPRGRGRSEPYR